MLFSQIWIIQYTIEVIASRRVLSVETINAFVGAVFLDFRFSVVSIVPKIRAKSRSRWMAKPCLWGPIF